MYERCENFDFECLNQHTLNLGVFDKNVDPDGNLFNSIETTCNYMTEDQFYCKVTKKNGLTILNVNCRSLKNSFDDIKSIVNKSNIIFDAITLSETWLSDNDDLSCYSLNNFELYAKNRTGKRGGGVLVYVNNSYECTHLNVYSKAVQDLYECVSVEINIPRSKNIVLSCIYRSPGTSIIDFSQELCNMCSDFKTKNVVLCGDFNINLLNIETCNQTKQFLDMLYSFGIFPLARSVMGSSS